MDDSHDSEVGSLNRRERLQNGSSVLSPTKSSSTSEEEGQFDEGRRAAHLQRINLQQTITKSSGAIPSSSSAPTITPNLSATANQRERSPLHSRRQTSGTHSDYWRVATESTGETSGHGNLAARIRGYEADSTGPSAPRWGSHRDERRPYYAQETRLKASPQAYRAYEEHTYRSSSTGAHDDRYREHRYSPTAGRYDDRDRDRDRDWEAWERDTDRERWQRGREWGMDERERDRERDYTRAPYARYSSPTHASSAAISEAARAYPGSWSGPASPSSNQRDRYLSGSAWERDRDRQDREAYDRERERWRYSSANEEPNQARYAHRTSPLRDSRENAASSYWVNRGSAPHLRRTKTSSSPSNVRSPEQSREASRNYNPAKRREESTHAKSTPDDEVEDKQQEASSPLDRLQASAKPTASEIEREAPVLVEVKTEAVSSVPAESLPEAVEKTTEVKLEAGAPMPVVISTTEDEIMADGNNEDGIVAASMTEAAIEPSAVANEDTTAVQAQDPILDIPVPAIEDKISSQDENSLLKDVDAIREDQSQIDNKEEPFTSTAVHEASRIEEVKETIANSSQDMQEVETAADIAMDTTEEVDTSFPPHLDLESFQEEDRPDDAPMPTPRTKEQQDLTRSVAIARMIQRQHPDTFNVTKILYDNRKVLTSRPHKPLESAIHGEYPRKDHIEPWLDDEDQEILVMRRKMMKYNLNRQKRLNAKVEKLRIRYRHLNCDWQRHCARLDRMSEARDSQNRAMGFTTSGLNSSTMSSSTLPGPITSNNINGNSQAPEENSVGLMSALHPSMTRANRRNTQTGFAGFGDAVRSEAEFLEILATLENADMQDPSMRAARTTATEPEMIINPDEKKLLLNSYDDDNGFVTDPIGFYCSEFDPDYWTEEEKTTFERRYALFPKQFGKIAASLPHKSSKQCVAYYYLTKHAGPDYKGLSVARNRDRKRKSRVKPKKGRGSALMADLKGDDVEEDDQQSPVAEVTGDGNTIVSLNSTRKGNASSRARMLTTSTTSGDLTTLAEEEGEIGGVDDSIEYSVGGSRKRRIEDTSTEDINKRGNNSYKTKRSRSDKKGRANSSTSKELQNIAMPPHPQSQVPVDPDMAAAEALGALAGGINSFTVSMDNIIEGNNDSNALSNRRKKSSMTIISPLKTDIQGEEGLKRSRQTTSSYWSVAERNEFLRSLAIYEKDWDAIAATLSTKSAAQARNYYARNVEEVDFVEAVTLAKENADLSLTEKQREALAFIQRRSVTQPVNEQRSIQQQCNTTPQSGYFMSGNSTARGLNINSLLNTEHDTPARLAPHRASMNDWFQKEAQVDESNDDTEEEDQPIKEEEDRQQMNQYQQQYPPYQRHEREPSDYFDEVGRSSRYVANDYATPTGHPSRYPMAQLHRHSHNTLSSMPPPSAFLNSARYALPNQRLLSDSSRSPLAAFHHQQQQQHQHQHGGSPDAYQQQQSPRYAYDRESVMSDTRGGWSSAASTPPSIVAKQSHIEQQRHASWPNVHSPASLGPSSLAQQSFNRGDTSSLSPFGGPPRSSSVTFQGMTSSSSSARSPFDRPQSGNNGQMSSIRSLSPLPPSQYQQQQQQQAPLPRLPPINQSLFAARRDSTDSTH